MQLRVVTILCAAVTAVELAVVVVRWTACSSSAPQPPPPPGDAAVAHFAPADATAPASPSKREFGELSEVMFERQFMTGTAIVPHDWPDGFEPMFVRYALAHAVRIATDGGLIELQRAAFSRMFTAELTIRSGTKLVIDYDAPLERPAWKGQLDCTLPADKPVMLAQLQNYPPLTDLEVVEHEHATGAEVRSHWRGTASGGPDSGYPPACVLENPDPKDSLEVTVRVPMPPVKGQIVQLVHREVPMRVQVNDSRGLACDRQLVRVVAFDHVPASSDLGIDNEANWIVARIGDSAFGFTCTGGGTIIPVKVGYGMTDLKCTLANDTLKCPGK